MDYISPGLVAFDTLEVATVCNTTDDVILRNVEINSGRELPWVSEMGPPRSDALAIVCGGPSLEKLIPKISWHKHRGDYILCVNHAGHVLRSKGIEPDGIVLLDAHPNMVECITPGATHYVASQCDPAVFDALADEKVILWQSKTDGSEEAVARGNKYHDGPYASIGGGVTVGLRAINLGFVIGWREINAFAMDSSFDGSSHAYENDWVPNEPMLRVEAHGREFIIEPWMGAQAKFYPYIKDIIQAHGGTVRAYGPGLIPWIDKHLEAIK